jgi:hypothetical protein
VGLVRLRGAFKEKGTSHERSDERDNVCDLSVNLATECDDGCFIENRGALREILAGIKPGQYRLVDKAKRLKKEHLPGSAASVETDAAVPNLNESIGCRTFLTEQNNEWNRNIYD